MVQIKNSRILFLFAVLLINSTVTESASNNSALQDDAEPPETVSCIKAKKRPRRTPPSGGIDDITEEMVEIHKQYTDAHSVGQFIPNDEMRK